MSVTLRERLIEKLRTEARSFVDCGRDWHVRVAAAQLMRDAADALADEAAHALRENIPVLPPERIHGLRLDDVWTVAAIAEDKRLPLSDDQRASIRAVLQQREDLAHELYLREPR
jgi:hypothetical protein